MSEPESFLERWSRRKREVGSAAAPEPAPRDEAASSPECGETERLPQAAESQQESSFDPRELPSIDSIGAETDVRGFLRPGVPTDLTRAALRRAWTNDPAIRDFVGLVENGWDFNDHGAIPGFGRSAVGDAGRLLSQAIGQVLQESEPSADTARAMAPQENPIEPAEPAPEDSATGYAGAEPAAGDNGMDAAQCTEKNNALQHKS